MPMVFSAMKSIARTRKRLVAIMSATNGFKIPAASVDPEIFQVDCFRLIRAKM
jgi:hypothetical protein